MQIVVNQIPFSYYIFSLNKYAHQKQIIFSFHIFSVMLILFFKPVKTS